LKKNIIEDILTKIEIIDYEFITYKKIEKNKIEIYNMFVNSNVKFIVQD
jgi:hypothetical protein